MGEPQATPQMIAGRYRVESTLGQGGMGVVYQVRDAATGKGLALKQLLADCGDDEQDPIAELFEHEYHTLAQLSHPRVVEVYDFGKDDQGAYYTMELLDGGDLHGLSPLPWQQACALLNDVCSVLSLLHSRRLMHRDLTPRNVRCTRDLKAKLIDFGAMVPMGPCKVVVGTPAFTAPETVGQQALDGRADLYSLGATLYHALTGRAPYPARDFHALRNAWRSRPRPPSAYASDIPPELDTLVLSLIDLDVLARPANAAEVMERLSAIASLEVDEQLLVSQAYLSTPVLVGRDQEVVNVRKRVMRALRGLGSAVMIESASGTGRSRFLDACVLEGKILGATVLRADASDAHAGNWGGVRAIAAQLLEALPGVALEAARPHVPVLGHILPELLTRSAHAKSQPPTSLFDNPQELRPRVQTALRDWLLAISNLCPLVIAVDDLHRVDEPSVAFIALLANEISERRVVVAVTAESDAPSNAASSIKLLRQASASIELANLSPEQTHSLLASVFGEAPNVQLLADRLFRVSQGSPSATMTLAQHLVDKALVRYEAGAWTLPSNFDALDLPDSLADTLKTRVGRLSDQALTLAQSMALSPEQSLTFDECLVLTQGVEKARLVEALNQLLSADILSTDGQHYALSQPGWAAVLIDDLPQQPRRALHLRLAEVFSQRGNQACCVASHLFEAGQDERGLDVLLLEAENIHNQLLQSSQAYYEYVLSLPRDWANTYERALTACERQGRPRKQKFLLQMVLTRISDHAGLDNTTHITEVVEQLVRDSGLELYGQLDDIPDAESRLWRALELTQQRFDGSPESERVLSPAEAIPELANTLNHVVGVASRSYDYELMVSMPSLQPLVPLSSALGVVDKIVDSVTKIFSAHLAQAVQGYREVIERIAQPDRGGLEDTIYRNIQLGFRYGLGMMEASFGIEDSIKWADAIEEDPLHQVNAWRIRLVHYLRQGDIQRAEDCKKKMEMLQIQNSPSQFYEGSHLYSELSAYTLADDLVRVKRTIEGLESLAERVKAWVPILHYARGEYHRIRGDYESALGELQSALSFAAPGRHLIWPNLMGAYLQTLFDLKRFEEAHALGEKALLDAQRADVRGEPDCQVHFKLALIQAALGEYENALAHCDHAFRELHALGGTGVSLGTAHETRARVAIYMGDSEAFAVHAQRCAELYQSGDYPALTAKYQRLIQHARQAGLEIPDQLACAADISDTTERQLEEFMEMLLADCRGPADLAQRVLDLLVQQTNSTGGFLYTVRAGGPVLSASNGDRLPSEEMERLVRDTIAAETDDSRLVTMTVADFSRPRADPQYWVSKTGGQYRPVLLGHNTEDGFAVTGLAILCVGEEADAKVPNETVIAVSRVLLEAGDVTQAFAAGL